MNAIKLVISLLISLMGITLYASITPYVVTTLVSSSPLLSNSSDITTIVDTTIVSSSAIFDISIVAIIAIGIGLIIGHIPHTPHYYIPTEPETIDVNTQPTKSLQKEESVEWVEIK